MSTLSVFSFISRPSASRKSFFVLPLASRSRSLWKSSDVCPATGIPLGGPVWCHMWCQSRGDAGRRKEAGGWSQPQTCESYWHLPVCLSEWGSRAVNLSCTFILYIVMSLLDACRWTFICLADGWAALPCNLCVSVFCQCSDEALEITLTIYFHVFTRHFFHIHQAVHHDNTLVTLCGRSFSSHL